MVEGSSTGSDNLTELSVEQVNNPPSVCTTPVNLPVWPTSTVWKKKSSLVRHPGKQNF